jgi:hypothetical protein
MKPLERLKHRLSIPQAGQSMPGSAQSGVLSRVTPPEGTAKQFHNRPRLFDVLPCVMNASGTRGRDGETVDCGVKLFANHSPQLFVLESAARAGMP